MDYTIIFDKDHQKVSENGTSMYSDVLYIPPGKTALLSLYNMVDETKLVTDPTTGKKSLSSGSCVTVHKLSLGQTGDITDVVKQVECGRVYDVQNELRKLLYNRRLFHEPVYQCGSTWTLNPCNNFALIPTPGFYMLELTDVAQFDTAYVEYALLDVSDSVVIPDDFKLGSK